MDVIFELVVPGALNLNFTYCTFPLRTAAIEAFLYSLPDVVQSWVAWAWACRIKLEAHFLFSCLFRLFNCGLFATKVKIGNESNNVLCERHQSTRIQARLILLIHFMSGIWIRHGDEKLCLLLQPQEPSLPDTLSHAAPAIMSCSMYSTQHQLLHHNEIRMKENIQQHTNKYILKIEKEIRGCILTTRSALVAALGR